MLTRIYGTAFNKRSDMEEYLKMLEEAKKRDHNKLGRELKIFMTDENIGQGLPLLMPRGAKIIQILQRFVEDEEERRGYLFTKTPFMAKDSLYKISGHWDHYRDKMFVLGDGEKDDEVLALRPMTCPFQYSIYNNGLKSYRDLPKRYAETATLFRKEASGEMHGLIRVRQFTLSDGHIVCAPEQLEEEFEGVMDLIYYLLKCLGLTEGVTFRFSRYDKNDKEKYIDAPEAWERAESILKGIIDKMGIKYVEGIGEAAFYGPKLDIQYRNVHGKEDTIITVQIDFAMAEKFGMSYVDVNGEKKIPYIIHRSSIGCYERTLAMLIEKYAGALPLWMSPEQVRIMSLTDRNADKCKEVQARLKAAGIRADVDVRNEKIGYKIREAQIEKIPYMVIIGDKESENNVLSIRSRNQGDLGQISVGDFIAKVTKIAEDRLAE
jgi:threonyl-tRNA synthetase